MPECMQRTQPLFLNTIVLDVVGNFFIVQTDYWKHLAEAVVFEQCYDNSKLQPIVITLSGIWHR